MKKEVKRKGKTFEKKSTKKKIFEKVPTGVPNFDALIGGGLNKESTNLIVGGAGSGKTILAVQFLVDGINAGERGLFVTFEETRKEIFSNMLKFGWDLDKLEKEKRFFFLEYTPEKVRTMLEEGGGVIENLVKKNDIKRIVIDSITSFDLLFDTEIAKREASLALFEMIRGWGCTALLTLERELTEEDLKAASSTPLEFEVDSIILLYFLRKDGERKRFLEILKMRGTRHSKDIHLFEIKSNGISVSKAGYKKAMF